MPRVAEGLQHFAHVRTRRGQRLHHLALELEQLTALRRRDRGRARLAMEERALAEEVPLPHLAPLVIAALRPLPERLDAAAADHEQALAGLGVAADDISGLEGTQAKAPDHR